MGHLEQHAGDCEPVVRAGLIEEGDEVVEETLISCPDALGVGQERFGGGVGGVLDVVEYVEGDAFETWKSRGVFCTREKLLGYIVPLRQSNVLCSQNKIRGHAVEWGRWLDDAGFLLRNAWRKSEVAARATNRFFSYKHETNCSLAPFEVVRCCGELGHALIWIAGGPWGRIGRDGIKWERGNGDGCDEGEH